MSASFLRHLCLTVSMVLVCINISIAATATKKFVVSIPNDKLTSQLQDGKRITEYTVKSAPCGISSFHKIPNDWWIKIQPELEDYQIRAAAGHGASWLTVADVRRGAFDKFIIIECDTAVSNPEVSVDISVDIPAEEDEKHIILGTKDLIFESY